MAGSSDLPEPSFTEARMERMRAEMRGIARSCPWKCRTTAASRSDGQMRRAANSKGPCNHQTPTHHAAIEGARRSSAEPCFFYSS